MLQVRWTEKRVSRVVGSYSDRGRCRAVNQDAYCYLEADTQIGSVSMAIVCDGVGGHDSGELASTTLISRFVDWFENQLPGFLTHRGNTPDFWETLRRVWDTLLQTANEDIFALGTEFGFTMGTTFTGILVSGGKHMVAHVGDCRLYEIRSEDSGPTCYQLTKDQTVVAKELEAGVITVEEAANHPLKNVILQSVGTQPELDPAFLVGDHHADSMYLICCDGFYSRLTSDELAAALSPKVRTSDDALDLSGKGVVAFGSDCISTQCESLANLAMDRGERDNLTAVAFADSIEIVPIEDADSKGNISHTDTTVDSESGASPLEEYNENPTIVVEHDEAPTVVIEHDEMSTIADKEKVELSTKTSGGDA